jgi:myo-inositol-1(or 4)-monophosphatase
MTELRSFAEELAREAGGLLQAYRERPLEVGYKGDIDLVTAADRDAEHLLRERIRARYPDHAILGEEAGYEPGTSDFCWVLDPVDGTTNYAHGFPYYCVSVGLLRAGALHVGAVFNPVLGELFSAGAGGGATLDGRPIRVSATTELRRALLTTGFPYTVLRDRANFDMFERFMLRSQAVRRAGSAALDLCHVACGRYDGFWERGLSPWDVVAGAVILLEAGGALTDYIGGPFDPAGRELLASNGSLHAAMIDVLANA